MKRQLALGIMSGTSIDGVDYALCSVDEGHCELRALWSVAFPTALRGRLHAAARGEAHSWEVAQLHHDLGRFYVRGAHRKSIPSRLAVIGMHGQTIFHQPGRSPATLQLGEAAYLAESLRVPVVSNFRAADLAAGGQGAPLATSFHVQIFGARGRHVCVNNLGGISNVTSIDWQQGGRPRVQAFDTGPANVLLDLAMRTLTGGSRDMDRNGAWAARGEAAEPLLRAWLRHPYFRRRPPKSTGRELFGELFFEQAWKQMQRARLSRYDVLATFTALTARSIADNYRRHLATPPETVILTGGGAANGTLLAAIADSLRRLNPTVRVVASDEVGWPAASIEAAAFAYLAWRRLQGLPGNLPETTGARREVLCGQITSATA